MPRHACLHLIPAPLLAALLLAPARAQSFPSTNRVLASGDEAIFLPPPDLVATGVVERAEWSPTGGHVAAVRTTLRFPARIQEPPSAETLAPETSLVLWNAETRRSQEVWRARSGPNPVVAFEWLPRTETAFALVDLPQPAAPVPAGAPQPAPDAPPAMRPQRWLFRLDAPHGAFRALASVSQDSILRAAPDRPVALLASPQAGWLRLMGADGEVRNVFRAAEGQAVDVQFWAADGSLAYHVVSGEGGAVKRAWRRFDPGTGETSELPRPPRPYTVPLSVAAEPDVAVGAPRVNAASAADSLHLLREAAPLPEPHPILNGTAPAPPPQAGPPGSRVPASPREMVHPLWLLGDSDGQRTHALVAADGDWASFSPRGDAILYVSEGSAWVVPLVRMPKALYLAARAAAERAVLLSNGKQVALALLMYSQDYDNQLPDSSAAPDAFLGPYVPSNALLDGFVYTFGGGSLKDVADPSKTMVGYIPGPGGRANVFLDGHVSWQAD